MRIMAISDLNDDLNNDLVTVNQNADTVTARYFSENTLNYDQTATFSLPSGFTANSVIITKT